LLGKNRGAITYGSTLCVQNKGCLVDDFRNGCKQKKEDKSIRTIPIFPKYLI